MQVEKILENWEEQEIATEQKKDNLIYSKQDMLDFAQHCHKYLLANLEDLKTENNKKNKIENRLRISLNNLAKFDKKLAEVNDELIEHRQYLEEVRTTLKDNNRFLKQSINKRRAEDVLNARIKANNDILEATNLLSFEDWH